MICLAFYFVYIGKLKLIFSHKLHLDVASFLEWYNGFMSDVFSFIQPLWISLAMAFPAQHLNPLPVPMVII